MANNVTDMSDFEKYPKYHLDKHGKAVQQILTTAESVFGMNAVNPKLQKTVGGAEYLVNENNNPAVFVDSFSTKPELGYATVEGVSVGNGLSLNLALANFANDDDIHNIFKSIGTPGESDDIVDITTLPTPRIAFTYDGDNKIYMVNVYADSSSSTLASNDHLCTINTYRPRVAAPLVEQALHENTFPLGTILPEFCLQEIQVISIGDGIVTADSSVATLYRMCPGIPSIVLDPFENIYSITAPDTTTNDIQNIFTGSDFVHSLNYKITHYDYTLGEIDSDKEVEEKGIALVDQEGLPTTIILDKVLDLGDKLEVYIDSTFATAASGVTPVFTAANTLITKVVQARTNYKTLTRPQITPIVESTNKKLQLTHSALVDGVTDDSVGSANKRFVCNIRSLEDTDWKDYDFVIEPAPVTGDADPTSYQAYLAEIYSSAAVVIDISDLAVGTSIRVKSVADYYNDSAYSYYTVTDGTTSGGGNGGISLLAHCDLTASDSIIIDGVITTEIYKNLSTASIRILDDAGKLLDDWVTPGTIT